MSRDPELFRRRYLELRIRHRSLRRAPEMQGAAELDEDEAEALVWSIDAAVRQHRRGYCRRPRWEAEREKA